MMIAMCRGRIIAFSRRVAVAPIVVRLLQALRAA